MQRTVFTWPHHHKMRNLYTMSLKISQLISSSSSFLLYFSIFLSFFKYAILCMLNKEKDALQNTWASLMAQMVKNLPSMQENWVNPWVRNISWRREWLPTPVFLPGEFHWQRSLVATVYGVAKYIWHYSM